MSDNSVVLPSNEDSGTFKESLFREDSFERYDDSVLAALRHSDSPRLDKVPETKDNNAFIAYRDKDSSVESLFKLIDTATFALAKLANRSIDYPETDLAKNLAYLANFVLEIITFRVGKRLCADRSTIFILDKETNELWSKIAQSDDESKYLEIRITNDGGIASHVAGTGETVNISVPQSSDLFNPQVDEMTGYKTRNILCTPIRNISGEVIGVIQLLNKKKGFFNQEDEKKLKNFSRSIGHFLDILDSNLSQAYRRLETWKTEINIGDEVDISQLKEFIELCA